MKGKFTYLKLLCCLFISIFIFGFGGEVRAETFNSHGLLKYRSYGSGYSQFFWIYDVSNGQDAYCLDSNIDWYGGNITMQENGSYLSNNVKNQIINILKKSDSLSWPSNGEKYYVTQAAIWVARHGYQFNGRGVSTNFASWLSSNYPQQWEALLNSRGDTVVEPELRINGSSNELTAVDDKMISSDFSISASGIKGNYTVTANGGNNACILYNGDCAASKEIPVNANFKIRVDKPSDPNGTVDASFTVVPKSAPSIYDLKMYSGSGPQPVGMITSTSKSISLTQNVKGNYTNTTSVFIQKVDSETGNKVAGAILRVVDSENNVYGEFTSTAEGVNNPEIKLTAGDYSLVEQTQPDGYYHNDARVDFTVTSGGEVQQNGSVVSNATISIENDRIKVKFRKVDYKGNPVEGVKIKIYNPSMVEANEANAILCAITDSNGYLTRECSGADKTNNVKANGEYTFGIDFGKFNAEIYHVKEYCESDSCKKYVDSDGLSYDFQGYNGFHVSNKGRLIYSTNRNLKVEDGNIITITMVNTYHLNISKVDITSGAEIEKANLVVTDPSITNGDNIIDEWESGTEPYTIRGIVPGHKYRLTETDASAGYSYAIEFVKMVNSVDFIMDEDGNVTTYDIVTGEKIDNLVGTKYELIVKNQYTKTVFSKTSAVTGEEIPGAKLKVCTSENYRATAEATGDGNKCDAFVHPFTKEKVEWVSEAGVSKIIDALPAGKYYLVEELAPVGYIKQTNSVSFNVLEDGTVTKVELKNEPTKVIVTKKDISNEEEIPGAHIKICTLDSYNENGKECTAGDEAWEWISDDKPHEIDALPFGDYVLIETLPAPEYEEGMIINGDLVTAYEFSISEENSLVKIDVYNKLLVDVPSTGISTLNLFAIGGLMVFAGYETIKIYRRKALN